MFVVGTGLMFLVALVLRRVMLASFFFLLCLGTREDAGLHLFTLLSILYILQRAQGASWLEQKPAVVFAVLAFAYSTGAVVLQHVLSNGEYSLLVNEYLGRPLLSQVSVSEMTTRFLGWVRYRTYVVGPAVCALVWSIVRRNPYIVLGYVGFVPWGLLHLMAAREMVGTLPSYYAFPYMFASFWPLIAVLIQRRHGGEDRSLVEPLCGFALLTVASFAPPQYQHNPTLIVFSQGFISPASIGRQAAMDRALHRLSGVDDRRTTLVDQSVLALVPEFYKPENILSGEAHVDPDRIIFFSAGFESTLAREMAAQAGLQYQYEVAGTPIRAATKRPLYRPEELIGLSVSK